MQTTYAERLKRARAEAGLSQAELARRLGLQPQAVQYLEDRDKNARGSKHTSGFAQALGVDAVWLSTGEGSMHPSGVREPAARYELAPAKLAKSIARLQPEIRQALTVVVGALADALGARTYGLSAADSGAGVDTKKHKQGARRTRAA